MATAAVLPQDTIQAFLSAGAAAVVSRNPTHKASLSAAEVAAYFRELYKALFEEQCSISDAVNAAGETLFTTFSTLHSNYLPSLTYFAVSNVSGYVKGIGKGSAVCDV